MTCAARWGRRFDDAMVTLQTVLCLSAMFALILSAYGWPVNG
jgi:hypothetical protein